MGSQRGAPCPHRRPFPSERGHRLVDCKRGKVSVWAQGSKRVTSPDTGVLRVRCKKSFFIPIGRAGIDPVDLPQEFALRLGPGWLDGCGVG